MKTIIFAGGAGTRLWPLSKKNTPKQFEPLFEGKSTLQLAVERVAPFGYDDVFISTNVAYQDLVRSQVPQVASDHVFTEPSRRDLGAAVLLTLMRMKRSGVSGTVAVLWSDHIMKDTGAFVGALKKAEQLIEKNKERFVFLAEEPRFANAELGWMHVGEKVEEGNAFLGWKYRPDQAICNEMFTGKEWFWNPGYFIFDIDFVLGLYQTHQPELFSVMTESMNLEGGEFEQAYGNLEKISFDEAIIEHLEPHQAVVIKVNMGWSDPGTLYALKETLANGKDDSVYIGNVVTQDEGDCFVYNEETGKLVAGILPKGMIVVNAKDSMLVCHKDNIHKMKALLADIETKGKSEYL